MSLLRDVADSGARTPCNSSAIELVAPIPWLIAAEGNASGRSRRVCTKAFGRTVWIQVHLAASAHHAAWHNYHRTRCKAAVSAELMRRLGAADGEDHLVPAILCQVTCQKRTILERGASSAE